MNIKTTIINNKRKTIIISIILICMVTGIIYIQSNSDYYAKKVQEQEAVKQKEDEAKQKVKDKEIADKFIDNLNNRQIAECIKILNDSHIDVNYKLDDGQTLYNKALNIALEKSADIKNMPTDYFPLFDKMNSTADKTLIKFYTNDLNYTQLNFLGCIGINTLIKN